MTHIGIPAETSWTAPTPVGPINSRTPLPGSKSMTARALVLAASAAGASSLVEPLVSRDTALMAAGLRAMGVQISDVESAELWTVHSHPLKGPARVDCGLAGTVMRFLPPLATLADGRIDFDGDEAARRRPTAPLLRALTALGARIDAAPGGGLPFSVFGAGRLEGGEAVMDASTSSQLASGLLLAAPGFDRALVLRHSGPPMPSAPHVRMTVDMLRAAGVAVDDTRPNVWEVEPAELVGRAWQIEPDLSNAAPFLAAALVCGGEAAVPDWPRHTSQPGDALRELLTELGGTVELTGDGLTVRGDGRIRGVDVDLSAVGELTPVIAALCALADSPSTLRGIAHLRGHETDRLSALARELNGLGSDVTETDDGLRITPRPLRSGRFDTYADHRMAQAAAVLGLAVPNIELNDVACTSKTLPQFTSLWRRALGAQF